MDPKLPEEAWKIAGEALKTGALESFGLSRREDILGASIEEGSIILRATQSLLNYRYTINRGFSSNNDKDIFDLFSSGVNNLSKTNNPLRNFTVLSEYERFPNLKSLYSEIENPFRRAAQFRTTYTAHQFREWIAASTANSDIDIIREYVDACAKREGLFESKPAKFFKVVSLIGIGHVIGLPLSLLATTFSTIMSALSMEDVSELVKTAGEFGLGITDAFLIDNIKVGWTPKAYFDGLRRVASKYPS